VATEQSARDMKTYIVDISMMSKPQHHTWKRTRLSPSLLFVTMQGGAWEQGWAITVAISNSSWMSSIISRDSTIVTGGITAWHESKTNSHSDFNPCASTYFRVGVSSYNNLDLWANSLRVGVFH